MTISRTLNLGVLAHVDAGKTSLTERLLYAAGVIDVIGSVDSGSTQTDTLALERQRGITIKSAVASFVLLDDDGEEINVNLIDTPGHPDFIAEVERALRVLDAAVLVISAVEGVQPQTRILWRALQRLRIPTIFFVNKMDRTGADYARVRRSIAEKLTPDDIAVYSGSAKTGAGVDELMRGIAGLAPAPVHDTDAPHTTSGTVFKIEQDRAGNKTAYVRMHAGTARLRQRLSYGDGYGRQDEGRVTAIRVFERGKEVQRGSVSAGQIAKLSGLAAVRIGDMIGTMEDTASHEVFAPPALETAIIPRHSKDKVRLYNAISQLAEADPLINLRQDVVRQELYVSLYGEVQKEVIQATLAADYGLEADFRETAVICVERPVRCGEAIESGERGDAFLGTVGLRIEPAPIGSGARFQFAPEVRGTMPAAFMQAVEDSVYETLRQGLHGWQVTDCLVSLIKTGYWPRQSHAHARFDKSMSSTGADFRIMTPLALMAALQQAGTVVCEPVLRFSLEVPADTLSTVMPALALVRATPETTEVQGSICTLSGTIPAARVYELQVQLPTLSSGEGVLETEANGYRPVSGSLPERARTDFNPLRRKEYLALVQRRA